MDFNSDGETTVYFDLMSFDAIFWNSLNWHDWYFDTYILFIFILNLLLLGIHLKRSLNRNAVLNASKQKQILKRFFEITSHVSMTLVYFKKYWIVNMILLLILVLSTG